MQIDLGVLGLVDMEAYKTPFPASQGRVTHSGYTEQGIRIHIFKPYVSGQEGFIHGELWNNSIMLDTNRLQSV